MSRSVTLTASVSSSAVPPSATWTNDDNVTATPTKMVTSTPSISFLAIPPTVTFLVLVFEPSATSPPVAQQRSKFVTLEESGTVRGNGQASGNELREGRLGFQLYVLPNSSNAFVVDVNSLNLEFRDVSFDGGGGRESHAFFQEVALADLLCSVSQGRSSLHCRFPRAAGFSITGTQVVSVALKRNAFVNHIPSTSVLVGQILILDDASSAASYQVMAAAQSVASVIATGATALMGAGPFEGFAMLAVLHSPCVSPTERSTFWIPWNFISPFASLGVGAEVSGNLLLVMSVVVLHGIVVFVLQMKSSSADDTFLDVCSRFRFPFVALGVVKWLFVSTCSSVFSLIFAPGRTAARSSFAVGFAWTGLFVVICTPILWQLVALKYCRVSFAEYSIFQFQRYLWLFPKGIWVPRSQRNAFGAIFNFCNGDRLWTAGYPLCYQLILCFFVYSDTMATCATRMYWASAWSIVTSAFVLIVQPYRVAVFRVIHGVSVFMVALLALFVGLSATAPSVELDVAKLTTEYVLVLILILRVLFELLLTMRERHWALSVVEPETKEHTIDDDDKRNTLFYRFNNLFSHDFAEDAEEMQSKQRGEGVLQLPVVESSFGIYVPSEARGPVGDGDTPENHRSSCGDIINAKERWDHTIIDMPRRESDSRREPLTTINEEDDFSYYHVGIDDIEVDRDEELLFGQGGGTSTITDSNDAVQDNHPRGILKPPLLVVPPTSTKRKARRNGVRRQAMGDTTVLNDEEMPQMEHQPARRKSKRTDSSTRQKRTNDDQIESRSRGPTEVQNNRSVLGSLNRRHSQTNQRSISVIDSEMFADL